MHMPAAYGFFALGAGLANWRFGLSTRSPKTGEFPRNDNLAQPPLLMPPDSVPLK